MNFIDLCSGAGGLALGLERAGFQNLACIDNDPLCCQTITMNRPRWNAVEADINHLQLRREDTADIDLISTSLPAAREWDRNSPGNLFERVLDLNVIANPAALLVIGPRELLSPRNTAYAAYVKGRLAALGRTTLWEVIDTASLGVAQRRRRSVLVSFRSTRAFRWPSAQPEQTVGPLLYDLMIANGWTGAMGWSRRADEIGPSIVGGSPRHGGPDLGPSGSRNAWSRLGVDAGGVADEAPGPEFTGKPKLSMQMVARLQGFPDEWEFAGRKTERYRQIGNAFPAPAAEALGRSIAESLGHHGRGGAARAAR